MPTLHWVGKDKVVIPAEDRAPPDNPHSPYLLGLNRETAWLFHYEPDRATRLDMDFLSSLRFGGDTGAARPGTASCSRRYRATSRGSE